MSKTEEDYVMSPDFNAIVYLNTGLSIGSSIKMRLEHVKVEYFEDTVRINQIHEVPTGHVDRIVRDAGKRSKNSRGTRRNLDGDKSKSLGDYV